MATAVADIACRCNFRQNLFWGVIGVRDQLIRLITSGNLRSIIDRGHGVPLVSLPLRINPYPQRIMVNRNMNTCIHH